MSRAAALLEMARSARVHIATAESCSGGMIAAALTDVAGSSDVVDRGFITYSDAAKTQMLGVDPKAIAAQGAVSEEVAAQMADGALARSDAQMAIAVTGIAGPGGSDHKPEGRVCFGLSRDGAPTQTETVEFGPIGRARVRQATVDHAIMLMTRSLAE